jgi:hypothetical protein
METTTVQQFLEGLSFEVYLRVVWEFKQELPLLPLEVWQHIGHQLERFWQWRQLALAVPAVWRSWRESPSYRNSVFSRFCHKLGAVVMLGNREVLEWSLFVTTLPVLVEPRLSVRVKCSPQVATSFWVEQRSTERFVYFTVTDFKQKNSKVVEYKRVFTDGGSHSFFRRDGSGRSLSWFEMGDDGLLLDECCHLAHLIYTCHASPQKWAQHFNFALFCPE